MSGRELLKTVARFVAHIAASPFLVCHAIKVPFIGSNRALEGSSQLLSLWPGVSGQYVRRAFLSWTIAECYPSASIGFGTILSKTSARIGENAYVGPYCTIGSVTIEKDVLVATGVQLLSGGRIHGTAELDKSIREQEGEIVHITIGAGSWIGAGAIVMADVGRSSIIGAGAVVTQPVPDAVIAAGVPARVIRSRVGDPPAE